MFTTFPTREARRKVINQFVDQLHPTFKSAGWYYRNFIDTHISQDSIVLDAGCGDGGIICEYVGKVKEIIGVDVREDHIQNNSCINRGLVSSLTAIPLPDNSVDVITSQFVLEHIENPAAVFAELYRVLRPGGVFIFFTPNIFNPIMLASRVTPLWFHKLYREKLLHNTEEAYPTFYRINTTNGLILLGQKTGFEHLQIIQVGNPEYLSLNKLTAAGAVLAERVADDLGLDVLKMYLVGCFIKG